MTEDNLGAVPGDCVCEKLRFKTMLQDLLIEAAVEDSDYSFSALTMTTNRSGKFLK
jgi:hypothetical protein